MAGGVEVRANAAKDVFLGSCPLYVELFEGDISNSGKLGSGQPRRLWCENPRVSTPLKSLPEIFDLLGPKLDFLMPTGKVYREVQYPVVSFPPTGR